jgi:hypothetical protein
MRVVVVVLCALAGCPEVIVAGPKETGYGEDPSEVVPDAAPPVEPEPPDVEGDGQGEVGVDGDAGDDAGQAPVVGEREDAGSPPSDAGLARTPATSLSLATTLEPHLDEEPIFNLTRPTDLASLEGPRPVVVWANTGCQRDDADARAQLQRWAGGGYVVLSLAAATIDRGILDLLASLQTTGQAEHAALIDWVVAQNERGPYAGKLDLARIVVAGDACGGRSALQVAATDDRVAGVFVSGALGRVDANVLRRVSVPVGLADRAVYAALQGPALLVQPGPQDGAPLEAAELALTWMELLLYGSPQAYDALTSPKGCDRCTPDAWDLESKALDTLVK